MKTCSVCLQKADFYTSIHKKEPFVDGRNYEIVCFTCYSTPRVIEQKYAPDGSVAEEINLDYSCENLCDFREIHNAGAADSLRHAKVCAEAVQKVCLKAKTNKTPRKRPKASWNIS
jgi:hypothetical protein